MTSLKQHFSRAAVAIVATAAALSLAGCGAGQISQTADQVPAVDGQAGVSKDGLVNINDVSLVVETKGAASAEANAKTVQEADTSHAHLAFAITVESKPSEKDVADNTATIKSITVDGQPVTLDSTLTRQIMANVTVIADDPAQKYTKLPAEDISPQARAEGGTSVHITAPVVPLPAGTAVGAYKEVVFTFTSGEVVKVKAPVTLDQPTGGTYKRNPATEVSTPEEQH